MKAFLQTSAIGLPMASAYLHDQARTVDNFSDGCVGRRQNLLPKPMRKVIGRNSRSVRKSRRCERHAAQYRFRLLSTRCRPQPFAWGGIMAKSNRTAAGSRRWPFVARLQYRTNL